MKALPFENLKILITENWKLKTENFYKQTPNILFILFKQYILFYLNLVLVLHFKTARCSFSEFFIVLSKIVWSKWFRKEKGCNNILLVTFC